MRTITILLAEDHPDVREGLKLLLESATDIEIVGEAGNGRQAVAFASKYCPDVVIMDISMPLIDGLEATRQILQTNPNSKILVLSSHDDDAYIQQAQNLGASGYLVKQTDAKFLAAAIRDAHHSKPFICPSRSRNDTPARS
jgi:DNA-binding NarL/FixJ family response regulator